MGIELLLEVQRQAEEERRYSLQKGMAAAESPAVTLSPLKALPSTTELGAPATQLSDTFDSGMIAPSPGMTLSPRRDGHLDISSFRSTGISFATRQSRRSSPKYQPPCGASTSVPDRFVRHQHTSSTGSPISSQRQRRRMSPPDP